MFGFGTSEKRPLADVKSAEHWLASLPANDPLAMHAEVVAQLRAAVATPAPQAALRQSGLEAIFRVDTRTAVLRRMLTSQYIEHANRSSRIENQLWQALFDLTQAFLLCYQAFGREIAQNPRPRREMPAVPLRAVDPGAVGGIARAVHAGLRAADRAAAGGSRRRRTGDDDRAGIPRHRDPAADEHGQPVGA
jgi:hypothetical protein